MTFMISSDAAAGLNSDRRKLAKIANYVNEPFLVGAERLGQAAIITRRKLFPAIRPPARRNPRLPESPYPAAGNGPRFSEKPINDMTASGSIDACGRRT
jgi:hypothetical protein